MRAIPTYLLTSRMEWRAPSGDPRSMGGEYGARQATERVRFEPSEARATGGSMPLYERYDGPTGTVFVDARNSVGGVPPVGSLVSVDGGPEVPVRSVEELRGFSGVHHWEVSVG